MPDDHSELVPPLPIPNRTVKRLSADDSAATSVKVGHRQAVIPENPRRPKAPGVFALGERIRLAPAITVSILAAHECFYHRRRHWPVIQEALETLTAFLRQE